MRTKLRPNTYTSNKNKSNGSSELTEEYLKILNYAHMGINESNYFPYVRNNQLFNWQTFT